MNRIEKLRQAALNRTHTNCEFFYRFYKRYGEYNGGADYLRYADAFYHAFCETSPSISDG